VLTHSLSALIRKQTEHLAHTSQRVYNPCPITRTTLIPLASFTLSLFLNKRSSHPLPLYLKPNQLTRTQPQCLTWVVNLSVTRPPPRMSSRTFPPKIPTLPRSVTKYRCSSLPSSVLSVKPDSEKCKPTPAPSQSILGKKSLIITFNLQLTSSRPPTTSREPWTALPVLCSLSKRRAPLVLELSRCSYTSDKLTHLFPRKSDPEDR